MDIISSENEDLSNFETSEVELKGFRALFPADTVQTLRSMEVADVRRLLSTTVLVVWDLELLRERCFELPNQLAPGDALCRAPLAEIRAETASSVVTAMAIMGFGVAED